MPITIIAISRIVPLSPADEAEGVWQEAPTWARYGMGPESRMQSLQLGSYQYYHDWLDQLSLLITGIARDELTSANSNGAFFKLLTAADCAVSFDAADAQSLYQDFIDHEEEFIQWTLRFWIRGETSKDDSDLKWDETYRTLKEAFALAADAGILLFM